MCSDSHTTERSSKVYAIRIRIALPRKKMHVRVSSAAAHVVTELPKNKTDSSSALRYNSLHVLLVTGEISYSTQVWKWKDIHALTGEHGL